MFLSTICCTLCAGIVQKGTRGTLFPSPLAELKKSKRKGHAPFRFFFLPPHCLVLPLFPLLSALCSSSPPRLQPSSHSLASSPAYDIFLLVHNLICYAIRLLRHPAVPSKSHHLVSSPFCLFLSLFALSTAQAVTFLADLEALQCVFHHSFRPPSTPSYHTLDHLPPHRHHPFQSVPPLFRPVPFCHSCLPHCLFLQAPCRLSSEPMATLHERCPGLHPLSIKYLQRPQRSPSVVPSISPALVDFETFLNLSSRLATRV